MRLENAKECIRFEQESFGALHQILSGLDTDAKQAAWNEVEVALEAFQSADGFIGPAP